MYFMLGYMKSLFFSVQIGTCTYRLRLLISKLQKYLGIHVHVHVLGFYLNQIGYNYMYFLIHVHVAQHAKMLYFPEKKQFCY